MSKYSGDPLITLQPDGASVTYTNGQPAMDQGLANLVILSLFTDHQWCGNIFLDEDEKVGSDFESTCAGALTLSKLANIEDAAIRALKSKSLADVSASASNPSSDRIAVAIKVAPPAGILAFSRDGLLWSGQAAKGVN
jgi:phage gp46-like protein